MHRVVPLRGQDLIRAVQVEARFESGEFAVAWVESQPIHKKTQECKVIDVALGVIERQQVGIIR